MNLLMVGAISKTKGHKLLGSQCAMGRAARVRRIFKFVKAYFTEQLLFKREGISAQGQATVEAFNGRN